MQNSEEFMSKGAIMKIKKLLIGNVFTCLWLLEIALNFLGYWLGCGYYTQHGSWQWWWWRILFFINHNIMFWPKRIPFFENFFGDAEGLFYIGRLWFHAVSLLISFGSCILVDFMLRKFLWNKIGKAKN
jgi:hypothetical protein